MCVVLTLRMQYNNWMFFLAGHVAGALFAGVYAVDFTVNREDHWEDLGVVA